jgi:hypothetical protein
VGREVQGPGKSSAGTQRIRRLDKRLERESSQLPIVDHRSR